MNKGGHLLGGILLVSGTTIGAAMLALPVSTGMAGFYPSILLIAFFWLFMTFTGLLMLEVNLWMHDKNTNLISMARETLGRGGEIVSWVLYLFLLYALTTAYIAGSSSIFIDIVEAATGFTLAPWAGSLPLLLIFGYFVYRGTRSVDLINRMLMMGLVIAYGCLVFYLTPHVNHEKFQHVEWIPLLSAVSVVATSYGYHIIIPSLMGYMERNISLLKGAIIIGSFIPLVVYILWEYLTLGIISIEGVDSISEGYASGSHGAHLVSSILGDSTISTNARIFSFFAIMTSFLGVSLSLSDFLADGLKIKKTHSGRLAIFGMTFFPPLLITILDPRAFLSALEYAGAFGVVVLLGLMPALMVWAGRYYHHFYSPYKAPGGRFALVCTIVISIGIIAIEIVNKLGFLTR